MVNSTGSSRCGGSAAVSILIGSLKQEFPMTGFEGREGMDSLVERIRTATRLFRSTEHLLSS
jgi:hypothetical protein